MMIAVDASRALHPQPTGIEIYSREIIRALLALPEAQKYRWKLLAPHQPAKGHLLKDLPAYARWEIIPGEKLWSLYHLSQYFRRNENGNDTLFVPSHVLPLVTPQRSVLTIHDFAFRYYPQAYGRLTAWKIDHELRRSARKANEIIVPSKATGQDLEKFYHIPTEHIHIIYHGVDHLPVVKVSADRKGKPYFLFIGRIEERKNVGPILDAYQRAVEQHPSLPDFHLIGRPGLGGAGIISRVHAFPKPIRDKIHFVGYQDGAAVANALAGATAIIFPSRYEGFGIPVLEAMRAGVPVLTSTASSLPEAAGDAALLVDPDDTTQITKGIVTLATDKDYRAELIERGREHVKTFTWRRAAIETLVVLVQSSS